MRTADEARDAIKASHPEQPDGAFLLLEFGRGEDLFRSTRIIRSDVDLEFQIDRIMAEFKEHVLNG